MKHQFKDGILYFYFFGELDNLSVTNLKQICIDLIEQYQPKMVKLDFEEVSFVDSTGIGFVLARYKQLKKKHAELVICNLSKTNEKLFQMSGIFQIIRYERNGVKL
ncbi:anti-sigma factor antagonist [[Eubacterium] hominis]|uniref:anti-sigma factor antagonist n=1 Tax=[Eubacterium] hominis TaxID=2764325 RepID=UPI003A4D49A9